MDSSRSRCARAIHTYQRARKATPLHLVCPIHNPKAPLITQLPCSYLPLQTPSSAPTPRPRRSYSASTRMSWWTRPSPRRSSSSFTSEQKDSRYVMRTDTSTWCSSVCQQVESFDMRQTLSLLRAALSHRPPSAQERAQASGPAGGQGGAEQAP